MCLAGEGEVFTDRLEHYTHLGGKKGCYSRLRENTYLTCLVVKMLMARKHLGQSVPLLCGQDCACSCLLLSARDTHPSGIVFFFTMLKAGAGRAGDSGESGHCSKGERTAQLTRC